MSNREIKFRGWDERKKEMFTDFPKHGNKIGLMVPSPYLGENGELVKYNTYHLMQFTGLKDKNGKEIYEGDYVKVNNSHILKIVWCNGAFKYMECKSMISMKFGDGWLHELNTICQCSNPVPQKNLEIIGNIYENPELLSKVESK